MANSMEIPLGTVGAYHFSGLDSALRGPLAERLGGPKWQRELARMIETGEKKGKMVLVGGGK